MNNLPPPLLIFDLDGTLAETAGDLIAALNHVMLREGAGAVPVAAARQMVGHGARRLIERGLSASGRSVTPARLEQLFADFIGFYEANIAVHSHLFPGVVHALDRFAAAGFTFAVCTNKMENASLLLLRQLGVLERFAFVCGQDTFGVAKPDPAVLHQTILRAGSVAGRSIMVGDSNTDILTARAAGVPVVAVDFGYTEVPVRELGPDRVISHFDDLWEAVQGLGAGNFAAQFCPLDEPAPHPLKASHAGA